MLQAHTRTINGHEYSCTVFPARKGFELQARIAKAVSPLVAGLQLKEGAGSVLDAQIEFSGEKLASALVGSIDSREVTGIVLALLETTYRDGVPLSGAGFDDAFAANYPELAEAVLFAVEANAFFGMSGEAGGLSSLAAVLNRLGSSTTASPDPGPSGDRS
jgi:hypothetical protein